MPGDDLISAGRDAGEFEASALVGDGIIRMLDHHHFGVHPDVAAVAAQVDQAGLLHGAGADLVGEGEWQIVAGGTIHVDGVQSGVGALHLEIALLGHEENVRNVAAVLLVEVTALLGQIDGFAGRDVLEINDGIGDAAFRADDQAFEADVLLAVGIANLGIFSHRKIELMRHWAGPFDGARDGAAVGYRDDFVVTLSRGKIWENICENKGGKQQKTASRQIPHSQNP